MNLWREVAERTALANKVEGATMRERGKPERWAELIDRYGKFDMVRCRKIGKEESRVRQRETTKVKQNDGCRPLVPSSSGIFETPKNLHGSQGQLLPLALRVASFRVNKPPSNLRRRRKWKERMGLLGIIPIQWKRCDFRTNLTCQRDEKGALLPKSKCWTEKI